MQQLIEEDRIVHIILLWDLQIVFLSLENKRFPVEKKTSNDSELCKTWREYSHFGGGDKTIKINSMYYYAT